MSVKSLQLKGAIKSIETANEYMLSVKNNDEVLDLVKGHLVGWIEVLSNLVGDRVAWENVQAESDYLIRRDFQKTKKKFKKKKI